MLPAYPVLPSVQQPRQAVLRPGSPLTLSNNVLAPVQPQTAEIHGTFAESVHMRTQTYTSPSYHPNPRAPLLLGRVGPPNGGGISPRVGLITEGCLRNRRRGNGFGPGVP
jgi:hypothetical protein